MAYFANGSDPAGHKFENQCDTCPLGDACPVWLVQHEYNYKQCDEGNEDLREALALLVGDDGTCHVRTPIVEQKYTDESERRRIFREVTANLNIHKYDD